MNIDIKLSGEGYSILELWLGEGQVQPWLQRAIDDKLRQRLDATILEHTNLNPDKLSESEKFAALKNVSLPTRQERDNAPV